MSSRFPFCLNGSQRAGNHFRGVLAPQPVHLRMLHRPRKGAHFLGVGWSWEGGGKEGSQKRLH